VFRVTKLTTKSSHNTAKDYYKEPQHTWKHSFEIPHPNLIYVLITHRPVVECPQTIKQKTVHCMEYIRAWLARVGEREGKCRYGSRETDGVTSKFLVPPWSNTEQNYIQEENYR